MPSAAGLPKGKYTKDKLKFYKQTSKETNKNIFEYSEIENVDNFMSTKSLLFSNKARSINKTLTLKSVPSYKMKAFLADILMCEFNVLEQQKITISNIIASESINGIQKSLFLLHYFIQVKFE